MRRIAIVMLLFVSLVGTTSAHGDGPPRALVSDPLGACQQALARATRQLGDGIRREIGKCIAAGMHCLTTAADDPAACCAAAAPRCRAQERKLALARGRLVSRIATGRCAALPIATILEPTGLGFATSADTCRCLPTPRAVSDLPSLAFCLGDLVDVETVRVLALAEAPRAAEALACVGLDRELATLTTADAVTACAPETTPTASAATPTGATPRPTRTRRPSRTPAPDASATASATTTATASHTATPRPTTTPTRTAVPPAPTATRTPIPVCGNGIVEGDEECDGNAYDDSGCVEDVCTCDDFCDDAGGRLACRRNCTIDFSRCTAGGCEF